ncbi:MAG: hypothetical protein KJ774_03240 [Firmicutes bacterium]|nr:hypothetical protein [Bacillota bacterium]
MEYDLSRQEMLELLSDIIQSSSVYGDQEQDLLNFVEEIREKNPITFLEKLIKEHPEIKVDIIIDTSNARPCALGYEEYNPDQTCNIMTCVECWLRKTE